jgi:anthranilate 1,2-dioxygenase small subunit
MPEYESRVAVERLQARHAAAIDEDRLEEWPLCFTEACRYEITSAENHDKGLPLGIFFADSRAMLEDRVASLRGANIYEAQRYRHIVSPPLIVESTTEGIAAQTNFLVVRIMRDGAMSIFAAGRYLDRIDLSGREPLFAEKIAILDNRRIDTLLALPI